MQHAAILLSLTAGLAGAPRAAAQTPDVLQIRAKTVLLGNGQRLDNGLVVIEGGKIRSTGPGEPDPALPLLEHAGTLTAGMVLAHSWFGTEGENHDSTRSVMSEARVVYAFHPGHSDYKHALEQGITTLVLAPTGQNLAGGKTCAVKTDGEVLKKEAHLALSFSKEALEQSGQPFFFLFDAGDGMANVDDGLEEAGGHANGARMPTSYAGSLAALEVLMQAPDGVFARARSGELPVLLEAWDRNEVARAVAFAEKHKLKGALRGAPLAGDLVQSIKESGLGVVLGPFDVGEASRTLAGAATLAQAGVPLAFSLGSSGLDPTSARLGAAMAVASGLDQDSAWKALTSDAARLAGVADRVGRLERGLDADLVLWSGDPLDLTSRVEMVFIEGKRVYGGGQ